MKRLFIILVGISFSSCIFFYNTAEKHYNTGVYESRSGNHEEAKYGLNEKNEACLDWLKAKELGAK